MVRTVFCCQLKLRLAPFDFARYTRSGIQPRRVCAVKESLAIKDLITLAPGSAPG